MLLVVFFFNMGTHTSFYISNSAVARTSKMTCIFHAHSLSPFKHLARFIQELSPNVPRLHKAFVSFRHADITYAKENYMIKIKAIMERITTP